MSAVENGDMVVFMLSDRSFNMQKIMPRFAPKGKGKIPRFDPFKGIYGVNGILFFVMLK